MMRKMQLHKRVAVLIFALALILVGGAAYAFTSASDLTFQGTISVSTQAPRLRITNTYSVQPPNVTASRWHPHPDVDISEGVTHASWIVSFTHAGGEATLRFRIDHIGTMPLQINRLALAPLSLSGAGSEYLTFDVSYNNLAGSVIGVDGHTYFEVKVAWWQPHDIHWEETDYIDGTVFGVTADITIELEYALHHPH